MRVSLAWLADLVRLTEPADVLAERLTMAGLAVEAIEEYGAVDPSVRVGRLVAVERHPDADRLAVCRVEAGAGASPVTIVSGAPGLRRGMRVAVAAPGARLADGSVVVVRSLRGIESAGALCSAAEVGLGAEHDRLLELPRGTAVGTRLADVPGVRDTVLVLEVTPNRGDCLSMLGVAREVACVTGARLRPQRHRIVERGAPAATEVRVELEDRSGCPRYLARIVRGVRVGRSPFWLQLRLERAGMRAVNSVVDAANHVMLELGQPLHTFDWARVRGGRIVVRGARPGERIETLDGVERPLETSDLVIADAEGAVAIAGVMGGARTEVREETTALLLESAYFAPASVRRSARRLGLGSEASYRFERRVDPAGVSVALEALAALLVRIASGQVAPGAVAAEAPEALPAPRVIALRPARALAALGAPLAVAEVRRRLRAIGATVGGSAASLEVTPPSYRGDLEGEADLVEELARLGGYDALPAVLPSVRLTSARDTETRRLTRRVRSLLVAQGLAEAVTPPFVSESLDALVGGWVGADLRPAVLVNPLSAEHSHLRRSPLAGLVRAARGNVDRGAAFVGLFEVGTAFGTMRGGERIERRAVAVLLAGAWPPRGTERQGPAIELGDVKGVVENLLAGLGAAPDDVGVDPDGAPALWHPAQSARILLGGAAIGAFGTIHPKAAQSLDISTKTLLAEVDFQHLLSYRPARSVRPLPRFPAVTRDIAVVVEDAFRAQAVIEEVRRMQHPLIESVRLFDCYRGDPIATGSKSLAYTIAYRAVDRTLTDDEVNAAQAAVRTRLQARFALELRS